MHTHYIHTSTEHYIIHVHHLTITSSQSTIICRTIDTYIKYTYSTLHTLRQLVEIRTVLQSTNQCTCTCTCIYIQKYIYYGEIILQPGLKNRHAQTCNVRSTDTNQARGLVNQNVMCMEIIDKCSLVHETSTISNGIFTHFIMIILINYYNDS